MCVLSFWVSALIFGCVLSFLSVCSRFWVGALIFGCVLSFLSVCAPIVGSLRHDRFASWVGGSHVCQHFLRAELSRTGRCMLCAPEPDEGVRAKYTSEPWDGK